MAPAVPGGAPAPTAVGRALGRLGDSWTLLILQRAFLGVRRFAGWRDELGISESVLAGRLREMTAGGLLKTVPYRDGGRTRLEYLLTDAALDLWSLFISIWSWERAWVPRAVPLPDLVHSGCGCVTDVVLSCGACGAGVGVRDTHAIRQPGLALGKALPPRMHPRRTRAALPSDPLSSFPGALEILGDWWGTAVLAGAMLGLRSFTQYQRELGVSPDVLSDRLSRFVELEVLASGPGGYRLTDKGRATFPIMIGVAAWGDRWFTADGCCPALQIVHRSCGAVLEPRLRCRECGDLLERRTVSFNVEAQV
ncbi:MAG: winged helix-turn-helix transcriptional regulator [Pseudonocardia sp.]